MKTGYTTGVFDLLHVGHIRLLKRARNLCDHLIIGVASDDLCRVRKKKTPVQNEHERMEIVSSIRYADQVVLQNEFNNIKDHITYNFDVLFKGDDWKGHPEWVKLEIEFKPLNVEIIYLPYTKGISSTYLKETHNL